MFLRFVLANQPRLVDFSDYLYDHAIVVLCPALCNNYLWVPLTETSLPWRRLVRRQVLKDAGKGPSTFLTGTTGAIWVPLRRRIMKQLK